jgi:hypothetical protein
VVLDHRRQGEEQLALGDEQVSLCFGRDDLGE